MIIKAPYNFVPLYPNVFFPSWAEKISHDIPFSKEAESGELILKIKAETPVFIRNGKRNQHSGADKEFSNYEYRDQDGKLQKKYFIPGTTVKGMIRNVLEIMSFGKMGRINDSRFAFRDLNSNQYDLKNNQQQIHCGWLFRNKKGQYCIQDCGNPVWISHPVIDSIWNLEDHGFEDAFKQGGFATKPNNPKMLQECCKTAKYKYEILLHERELNILYDKQKVEDKWKVTPGTKEGILVVTGQPMVRCFNEKKQKWEGKYREFVFPIFDESQNSLFISDILWKEFLFQYYDHDPMKISTDWKFWKDKLKEGEKVPVFFRKGNQNSIQDFGLTFLYKLPYKNTIKDLLKASHKDRQHDLAELMFGYISSEGSLKGRIQFGHAEAVGQPLVMPEVKGILSSPKASYYPNYLKQYGTGGILPSPPGKHKGTYETYMNDAELAGWKRYPVHNVTTLPIGGENMNVNFIPLSAGSEFICKIRFHNLLKQEIGALLSAINFHGNSQARHSLGMAKPYGYGRVKCEIKSSTLKWPPEDYMGCFETLMDIEFFKSKRIWHNCEQIKELLKMASIDCTLVSPLYMTLDEHTTAKGSNAQKNPHSSEYLQSISALYPNYQIDIQSLEAQETYSKYEIEYQKREEAKVLAKKQEEERLKSFEEEKKQKEQEKQEAEKKRKEEEENRKKDEKVKMLQSSGLAFLIGIERFDKLGNRITDWLKKVKLEKIPEQEYGVLEERLMTWYKNAQSKPRDLKLFRDFIDKKVIQWVVKEKYEEWKNKFLENKSE